MPGTEALLSQSATHAGNNFKSTEKESGDLEFMWIQEASKRAFLVSNFRQSCGPMWILVA